MISSRVKNKKSERLASSLSDCAELFQLTDTQLQAVLAWIEAQRQILAVRFYGSRAKSTAGQHCDIDLAPTVQAKTSGPSDADRYTTSFLARDGW